MHDFECLTVASLFGRADSSRALPYLQNFRYPWEALGGLADFIAACGAALLREGFEEQSAGVWVARDAQVAASATLAPPCIVCEGAELRTGAFLRGGVLVGRGAVVGNSCELKNCILFDGAQVPHFNYVGDAILGYRAHLGAGAVTSNVKGDRGEVFVRIGARSIPTGRQKCGAFLGDFAEIGCHAVLNPGTVVGARAQIYPLCSVRGFVPADCIYKRAGEVVLREKR